MKYLTDKIAWNNIQVIGFDLDGTLYDEFSFIEQVYPQVLKTWGLTGTMQQRVLHNMLERWIEKGSSYPFIFDETLVHFKLNDMQKNDYIQQALSVFRNYVPQLHLSSRIRHILHVLKERYRLFLFTDGNVKLQSAKILSLGLNEFFSPEVIFISGQFGPEYIKPGSEILSELELVFQGVKKDKVLYIGDRVRDFEFAENAGFKFCYISNLFDIQN